MTLLLQEPYSLFGAINPTGHAAIYLSRVCAETPVILRTCRSGESGIVISRYSHIAGYDWIAIPLIPYLYAVERVEDVPAQAGVEFVARLRDDYRRKHLRQIVPDVSQLEIPKGTWVQLIGAAYNRKIYGLTIETSEAQDNLLITMLNSRRNTSHFNLLLNNCADFARHVLNDYYPGAIRRNVIGDAGITTPKQIAKCLAEYSKTHPELQLTAFYLAQIPGSRRPSRKIENVFEAFIKTKYIVPLAVFQPWAAGLAVMAYVAGGHFNIAHTAEREYEPLDLVLLSNHDHQ